MAARNGKGKLPRPVYAFLGICLAEALIVGSGYAAGFALPLGVQTKDQPAVLGYSIGVAAAFENSDSQGTVAHPIGSLGLESKKGTDAIRLGLTTTGKEWEIAADWKTRKIISMVGVISTAAETRLYLEPSDHSFSDTEKMAYFEGQGAMGNMALKLRLSSIGSSYGNDETLRDLVRTSDIGVASWQFLQEHSGMSGLGLNGKYRVSNMVTFLGDAEWDWPVNQGAITKLGLGAQVSGTIPGTFTVKLTDRINNGSNYGLDTEYSLRVGDKTSFVTSLGWQFDTPGISLATYSAGATTVGQDWELGLKAMGARTDQSNCELTTLGADLTLTKTKSVKVFVEHRFDDNKTLVGGRLKF